MALDKFYLGDAFDILPLFPDEFFDLIIIDPPYNMRKFDNDKFTMDDYLKFTAQWTELIWKKMKPTASLYCFASDKAMFRIEKFLSEKMALLNILVWNYNSQFIVPRRNYEFRCEYILFYAKSADYTFNRGRESPSKSTIARWKNLADENGNIPYENLTPVMQRRSTPENYEKNPIIIYRGSYRGNILSFPRVGRGNNSETRFGKHPTQKPEELIDVLIHTSSNEKDIILDPFSGIATSLVVAKRNHRHFVGTEINEKYYEIGKLRLRDEPDYQSLLPYMEKIDPLEETKNKH